MSKQTREFLEQVKSGEQPTVGMGDVMKGVGEFVKETFPGLSLSKILHDVGQELKQQAAHGSHELAAALFRGDAYVMYPRTNQADGPDRGLPAEAMKQPEFQQEQNRGGREM